MFRPLHAAGILLLSLGGCMPAPAGRSDDASRNVPAARVVGEARSCIPLTQIRESRVRNDWTIDFLSGSRRGWRVALPARCPSLGLEERFSYETSLTQLCSTDLIHVLHSAGGDVQRGASCGLGQFVPIELGR